jgi:hypothetical protein
MVTPIFQGTIIIKKRKGEAIASPIDILSIIRGITT